MVNFHYRYCTILLDQSSTCFYIILAFTDADPSLNEIHHFPIHTSSSSPSSTSSSSSSSTSSSSYYINSQHDTNHHQVFGSSPSLSSHESGFHYPTRPPRPPRASRPSFSRPPHPSSSTELFSSTSSSYEDDKDDYEHFDDHRHHNNHHEKKPFVDVGLGVAPPEAGSSPSSLSRASTYYLSPAFVGWSKLNRVCTGLLISLIWLDQLIDFDSVEKLRIRAWQKSKLPLCHALILARWMKARFA